MSPAVVPAIPYVDAYRAHRQSIGVLGTALPFLVSLGAWLLSGTPLRRSVSAYYHADTRDVFVGALFAIGFFLFSYVKYKPQHTIAGRLAGIFAIVVALFPTASDAAVAVPPRLYFPGVHGLFAALLFLTLTYFSLVLFPITDQSSPAPRIRHRNLVYRICGSTMLACIVLIAAINLLKIGLPHAVFCLETILIEAFGFSWLIKGQAFLKD